MFTLTFSVRFNSSGRKLVVDLKIFLISDAMLVEIWLLSIKYPKNRSVFQKISSSHNDSCSNLSIKVT